MMYKKFVFQFAKPISCYGELISGDTVIAANLKAALKILRREHHYARVASFAESDIELYTNSPRMVESSRPFTASASED